MIAEDELRIIKKILGGDKDAFEELVLANQKNVYNLALKMTKDESDALDISQEAFLKAYIQIGSYRGESRFSVWLYRLTYNLCIDFLRKKQKTATVSLAYQDDDDSPRDIEIPDKRELPEDVILRRETRKTIAESIDKLDRDYREILIMREITGMSYSDIAVSLNISVGTVKSRLSRARQNLVTILARKGTFPGSYRHNERKEAEGRG